jgi:hypothetical protein
MADKPFKPMGELPAPGMPETKNTGRPSSYDPSFCNSIMEIADIAANGATDEAIAVALGVSRASVIRWREEHPEFAVACAAVKQIADDRMEASLFQRGLGYSHKAVKIFMPAGAEAPVYADYTEHYPPETAAASLWLRNRRPKDWRDRVEHTGADGKDLPAVQPIQPLEIAKAIGLALRMVDESLKRPGDGAKVINAAPAPRGDDE